jgi:hypothetical protein
MRSRLWRRALAVFVVALLCDCGAGEDDWVPAPTPGMVRKETAASKVRTAFELKAALESGDGAAVGIHVVSIGIDGASFVLGVSASATATALVVPGPYGGSVDCSEGGCLFSRYGAASNQILDGSVSVTRSDGSCTVTVNLVREVDSQLIAEIQDARHRITGRLVFGSDQIDGSLRSSGGWELTDGEVLEARSFTLVRYDGVTVSGDVAVGGSVYGKWAADYRVDGVLGFIEAWDGTVYFP